MQKEFMKEALAEARLAYDEDEVPVGCVIVLNGIIVARNHNRKIQSNDSLCHAEMLALHDAQKALGTKYLSECEMYLTLEPCPMCAGAMINARLGQLYFGAREPKFGCCGSQYDLLNDNKFNHKVNNEYVPDEDCSAILSEFFVDKRRNKC